ncbi:MAG TPA: prolyl oligopeptidase family serine peptidase, partial [Ktedonobacterales bacterium]
MKLRFLLVMALLVLAGGATAGVQVAHAASSCLNHTGTSALTGSIDGANYKIEVPANWNGTLVLYSHGYVFPGNPLVATDVGDPLTGGALLSQGYALAGSSYSAEGWALQQAFQDQIALLNFFDQTCGQPTRTIAWGHSLGGIITAGLVQLNPGRFSAALPMCGVLA